MIQLPIIDKIMPELVANTITGIQPMSSPEHVKRKRHWEIIPQDGKWILTRWWTYSIFTLARPKETPRYHTETTVFNSEAEAEQMMLLEQLEQ